jgi:hypothetical protein
MKCAKRGCPKEAEPGSNYCADHKWTIGDIEHRVFPDRDGTA